MFEGLDGEGGVRGVKDRSLEPISRSCLQAARSLEHRNEMLIRAPWLANQKLRAIRVIQRIMGKGADLM